MLGLSSGLYWRNRVKKEEPIFDPNLVASEAINENLTACQAWYDFTDQTSVFRDNGGLYTIGENEHIGRIENKAQGVRRVGSFLRGNWNDVGGDGGGSNPKFKLNGVNGHSYANFDASYLNGYGQGLSASDYFSFGYQSSGGHGGGSYFTPALTTEYTDFDGWDGHPVGWYPNKWSNGSSSPNDNYFSFWSFYTNDTTIFWVIKPASANPSGFGSQTHWMFRPDYNDPPGASGRGQETYVEGCTKNYGDLFGVRYNDEQSGTYGVTYTSTGGDVTDDVNILFAIFNDDGLSLSQNGSELIDTEAISSNVAWQMKSGMMAIGQWPLGNVHSGVISGSAFDGDFCELIIFNKALDSTELGTVLAGLSNKYN